MARIARSEVFRPEEVATVHVTNRCVRGLFLMGKDAASGRDYSHRRNWFALELERSTNHFAIDLLEHSIMDNHFHLLLRSRPDVVQCWNNREVARRWLMLCPKRKHKDGSPKEPTQAELRSLTKNPDVLKQLRLRLSDISWFVRKICQNVAQRANKEVEGFGKFWESRFKAVRLLDEEAVLACSAYINLNPIRASITTTLENSHFTSIEHRIGQLQERAEHEQMSQPLSQLDDTLPADALERVPAPQQPGHLPAPMTELLDSIRAEVAPEAYGQEDPESPEWAEIERLPPLPHRPGGYLAPLEACSTQEAVGPSLSRSRQRCSDRGYLEMPLAKYVELVEWSARQIRDDKRGYTPEDTPSVMERLGIPTPVWMKLVNSFGEMFSVVAGMPESVDAHRGSRRQRFHMPAATRELLTLATGNSLPSVSPAQPAP